VKALAERFPSLHRRLQPAVWALLLRRPQLRPGNAQWMGHAGLVVDLDQDIGWLIDNKTNGPRATLGLHPAFRVDVYANQTEGIEQLLHFRAGGLFTLEQSMQLGKNLRRHGSLAPGQPLDQTQPMTLKRGPLHLIHKREGIRRRQVSPQEHAQAQRQQQGASHGHPLGASRKPRPGSTRSGEWQRYRPPIRRDVRGD
jgi:hypothetical protein